MLCWAAFRLPSGHSHRSRPPNQEESHLNMANFALNAHTRRLFSKFVATTDPRSTKGTPGFDTAQNNSARLLLGQLFCLRPFRPVEISNSDLTTSRYLKSATELFAKVQRLPIRQQPNSLSGWRTAHQRTVELER